MSTKTSKMKSKKYLLKKAMVTNALVLVSSGTVLSFVTDSLLLAAGLAVLFCLVIYLAKIVIDVLNLDLRF